MRAPLDELESTLDPALFMRVHRSFIVRRDRVGALRRLAGGGAELVMSDGTVVPVSRRRRARVIDMLELRGQRG